MKEKEYSVLGSQPNSPVIEVYGQGVDFEFAKDLAKEAVQGGWTDVIVVEHVLKCHKPCVWFTALPL